MLSQTPTKFVLFPLNTQVLTLTALQDALTDTYLNAATITATLVDDDGNEVTGCIDVPLTYVSGSNGDYQGVFGDNTFNPNPGTEYYLIVDGTQAGSYIHLELLVEIKARKM